MFLGKEAELANIQDIARHTGLSTATISRYMNGKPYVSKEAQLAIELAMERLDYHPNSAARTLRSGKTRRVTVVVERADHTFYSLLLAGMSEVAWKYSYDVLLQQIGAPDWSPSLILEQAAARSMDGVVVAADGLGADALRTLIGTLPVVACDQALFGADCPHVFIDHYESTMKGLEYLHERGAIAIACVTGPSVYCASDRFRRRAYAEFAKRKSAPVVHEVIVPEDSIKAGYELLTTLRSLDPVPDAVFTGSDDLAAGLVAAAKREGLLVPHDLAVLGFDDQPIAEVFDISTIRQPVRLMGRRAMEVLMKLIELGLEAPVQQLTKVKYSLVKRMTA